MKSRRSGENTAAPAETLSSLQVTTKSLLLSVPCCHRYVVTNITHVDGQLRRRRSK
jgi:hypothetical protein